MAWLAESGLRNQKTRLASSWRRVRSANPVGCEMETILASPASVSAGVQRTRTVNGLVFCRLAIRSGTAALVDSQEVPSKVSRPESAATGARGTQASSEE